MSEAIHSPVLNKLDHFLSFKNLSPAAFAWAGESHERFDIFSCSRLDKVSF